MSLIMLGAGVGTNMVTLASEYWKISLAQHNSGPETLQVLWGWWLMSGQHVAPAGSLFHQLAQTENT